MSDNKCKWKSKYHPDYKCEERVMELDGSYCILHSRLEHKGTARFIEKVKDRMQAPDEIDLIGCYFPKDFPADFFENYTFAKPVDFSEATFLQRADFSSTAFVQKARFYDVTFLQEATFSDITFSQKAVFTYTTFSQKTYFFETKFLQEALFEGAFLREVDFSWAKFSQVADFAWAKLQEVYFRDTLFVKGADFSETEMQHRVVFQNVDLSQCSFLHSNIDKVDFRDCKFGEVKEQLLGIIPSPRRNVLKDEINVDEDVNKKKEDYEPVCRLYQELKKNFEEKKDWNTAGDFHYGEMECRRKMKGALGREFFSLEALYRRASGYGERPWRAGFWTFFLIAFFALFYIPSADKASPVAQLVHTSAETTSQESAGSTMQGHPAVPGLPAKVCSGRACSTFKRYLEGLNTSLRVTARLDTEEKGWPRTIQSILGPILIALFFLALRRKVKR